MCDFPPIKPLLLTRAHLHTHTHTYPAAVTYRLTVTITQAQTPLSLSTAVTEISHSPRASFTSTSPVPPASSSRASDQTRPVTTCPAALRSLAPRATFVIVNHAGASLSLPSTITSSSRVLLLQLLLYSARKKYAGTRESISLFFSFRERGGLINAGTRAATFFALSCTWFCFFISRVRRASMRFLQQRRWQLKGSMHPRAVAQQLCGRAMMTRAVFVGSNGFLPPLPPTPRGI